MTSSEQEYPSIGVGGIIFKDDCVLLIQRGTPPRVGQWSIPGGRQEWGETVEEALIREIKEETGISITIGSFVDVIDYLILKTPTTKGFHYTLLDYWGNWQSGELSPNEGEIMDAKWVLLDELDHYNLWSETTRVIKKAWDMKMDKEND